MMVIEDPNELINMSADLVDKCESSTIKTFAVELLHSFESFIDGMASFILDFCLNFLGKTIHQDEANQ